MDILPSSTPEVHIVYSVYPLEPAKPGDPLTQIEIKVHVAIGHRYRNKVWVEAIPPGVNQLLAEMGKVAGELKTALGM